jgi:hypothetical protein
LLDPTGPVEWKTAWAPNPALTFQRREKYLARGENNPRFLGSSVHSTVTVLTELPHL